MPSRNPSPDLAPEGVDPVREALRAFLNQCSGTGRRRIAFSGGRDSSVLLHAAAQLAVPGLEAMHIDHGLRPDSAEQAAFCQRVAAALGVPLTTRRLASLATHGAGVEAAARAGRYAALREGLGERDLVLTAQHADDQAETFLLAALRGSGPEGLKGMLWLRREGGTWLGRPLLELGADTLATYARDTRLEWFEDPSNRDTRFDRNFLRQEILPRLQARFDVPSALVRAAGWQRESLRHQEAYFAGLLDGIGDAGAHTLAIPGLLRLEPHTQRGLLRYWLRQRGIRPPGHRRLGEFLRQLAEGGSGAAPGLAWADGWLRTYRGRVHAGASGGADPGVTPRAWPVEQEELVLADGRRLARADLPALGLERDAPLEVVGREAGEVVHTPKGRRSLKKLMQQRGVPPWERHGIPLLRRPDGTLVAVLWDAVEGGEG